MHFDQYWDYNNPEATEKKFRELLSELRYAENPEAHLQLRTQIARALGLQMKFTEAHQVLDTVETQLSTQVPLAEIRYFLERGRTFRSSGNPEKGKRFFLKAWEAAQSQEAGFYAVDAAHMLGMIGSPEDQLEWNRKAMMLAESSTDPRAAGWLGSLYNNIGWTYHDMGKYEQAMEVFQKGLAWRESKGQKAETRIAKWCVARTHRSLNQIDHALAILRTLESEFEREDEQDGYVFEELAECLLLQNNPVAARPYFKRAYDLLSQDPWLVKNESDRLHRLKTLTAS